MRLHEFEAATIFAREGIPVPEGRVASSPQAVREAAAAIGPPVVVKAQVLVGGRGKSGGIQSAEDEAGAERAAARIFSGSVRDFPVREVLVCRKIPFQSEMYMGVVVDGYRGCPTAMISSEGGVSVEEISRKRPHMLISREIPADTGLRLYQARDMAREAGLAGPPLAAVSDILFRLVQIFFTYEALIAEINPLAMDPDGSPWALDAVLEIDDSARRRVERLLLPLAQRDEDPLVRRAREIGVSYVDLDGDIGIISSGAGLGMATMDIVASCLRPANFLETGGGITEQLLYNVMELIFRKDGLRGVIINLYGGINPIHEGAKGIVRFILERKITIPIVAKALGNRQEETWEILRIGGVEVVTDNQTERCVQRLVEMLGEKKN
ncbi:MAG: acetate--CoA ligase family protein [Deltaproteobacteria bacterium]|nr:acetate--CoA ligase family protein [Deltaproteobacteria bacterium]